MGLGSFKTAWQRQTKDFGHDQASRYTCLILDNRGMGESDKPWMRYSTSEMAKDIFEVLDYLGWTDERQLHIIGISMGGMIAQELVWPIHLPLYNIWAAVNPIVQALLIPERIASLTLLSTAARIINTVVRPLLSPSVRSHPKPDIAPRASSKTYETASTSCPLPLTPHLVPLNRTKANSSRPGSLPKDPDIQLAEMKARLFSPAWLAAPDANGAFPTNGDRFAAQELRKRQDTQWFTRTGFTLQAIAAGWHHKSAGQLKELADRVGRARVQVVHGDVDQMITVPHAEVLVWVLGGEEGVVTRVVFEGRGHVLPMEEREEFRRLVEGFVDRAEKLGGR